ncbi:uncharacterized protein METZ01_LOCUS232997, partial [marine metagenome]
VSNEKRLVGHILLAASFVSILLALIPTPCSIYVRIGFKIDSRQTKAA